MGSDEKHKYSDALPGGDTKPIRKRSEGKAVLSSRPLCETSSYYRTPVGLLVKRMLKKFWLVSKGWAYGDVAYMWRYASKTMWAEDLLWRVRVPYSLWMLRFRRSQRTLLAEKSRHSEADQTSVRLRTAKGTRDRGATGRMPSSTLCATWCVVVSDWSLRSKDR